MILLLIKISTYSRVLLGIEFEEDRKELDNTFASGTVLNSTSAKMAHNFKMDWLPKYGFESGKIPFVKALNKGGFFNYPLIWNSSQEFDRVQVSLNVTLSTSRRNLITFLSISLEKKSRGSLNSTL